MCSCPPHGLCRVSRAEQITGRGTWPQGGGLWRPCGGEGTPHLTSQSSPSPSHPGIGGRKGGGARAEMVRSRRETKRM